MQGVNPGAADVGINPSHREVSVSCLGTCPNAAEILSL